MEKQENKEQELLRESTQNKNKAEEKGYKDYYTETIDKYDKGLKLVLGPTGLGKTYGFREAVKKYCKEKKAKKFIYMTSRHQLIKEQEKEFKKEKISIFYVKSQSELIEDLLGDCKSERDNCELAVLMKVLEEKKLFEIEKNNCNKLKKSIESTKKAKINLYEGKENYNEGYKDLLRKDFDKKAYDLFRFLKEAFINLNKAKETEKNRKKKARLKNIQKDLLKEELVKKLFPYVGFDQGSETVVLMGTVKKFMCGVFNGKKVKKITSFEKNIIILDEFDFLEKEILDVLTERKTLSNPIAFVRSFYEDIDKWYRMFEPGGESAKGKMKVRDEMKDRFDKIKKSIEERYEELGFPDILDFKISDKTLDTLKRDNKRDKNSVVLFQSNTLITSSNFYIIKDDKSKVWSIEVGDCTDKKFINRYGFFSLFVNAVRKICNVLYQYMREDWYICEDIIDIVWNSKNDDKEGACQKYIRNHFPTNRQSYKRNDENEEMANLSIYEVGYNSFQITKENYSLPEKAKLTGLGLPVTPEIIIKQLAEKNLVFGLSATAKFDRLLQSFDIGWLKKELNNSGSSCENKENKYLETTQSDKSLIKEVKKERDKGKFSKLWNNSMESSITENETFVSALNELRDFGFFGNLEKNKGVENRKERIVKIFKTIEWILEECEGCSHLMFLSSFKHMKEIIERDNKCEEFFKKIKFINLSSKKNSEHMGYSVEINNKSCNIIFLDAKEAKKLFRSNNIEKYKKIFKQNKKVVIITQYNSASNGVNIPCYNNRQAGEVNFSGIHLVESSYYWFDKSEDHKSIFLKRKEECDDETAKKKKALWYLIKLKKGGEISEAKFRTLLGSEKLISEANIHYRDDVLEKKVNIMALYYQALGRAYRKGGIPNDIEVSLGEDVKKDFNSFLRDEYYADIVEKNKEFTASFILQLQDEIVGEAEKRKILASFQEKEDISSKNREAKERVENLLKNIEKLQEGNFEEEKSKELKKEWKKLRRLVIKQEYRDKYLNDYVHETNHVYKDNNDDCIINYDHKNQNICQSECSDVSKLNLNKPYNYIKENKVIKNYFARRDYPISYVGYKYAKNPIFLPCIQQAILLGAIGEESITALLESECIEASELPDKLFEVVDAKVKDLPMYIDFKNWGQTAIEKQQNIESDYEYDPTFNSEKTIKKMREKWGKIKEEERKNNPKIKDEEIKLVLMNLVGEDNLEMKYFIVKNGREEKISATNEKGHEGAIEKSNLIILPASINKDIPNEMTKNLNTLIKIIEKFKEEHQKKNSKIQNTLPDSEDKDP